ncbi:MAG TPA: hypothetical protein PK410_03560, partial [Paludibacteraceae bacterium]|nr:hypothetical protein [Paludibacteraceae bacterium]
MNVKRFLPLTLLFFRKGRGKILKSTPTLLYERREKPYFPLYKRGIEGDLEIHSNLPLLKEGIGEKEERRYRSRMEKLKKEIIEYAIKSGFVGCGVAGIDDFPEYKNALDALIKNFPEAEPLYRP